MSIVVMFTDGQMGQTVDTCTSAATLVQPGGSPFSDLPRLWSLRDSAKLTSVPRRFVSGFCKQVIRFPIADELECLIRLPRADFEGIR
jgi:hypothetical protein